MRYRQTLAIGGQGGAPEQFAFALNAIGVDRQDFLYAAGGGQLKMFDASGRVLRQWTTAGSALALAAHPDGSIWSGGSGLIQIFDRAGKLVREWRAEPSFSEVTAIGFLDGEILVGDVKDRAIRRYDASLRFLNSIGKDARMGGLLIPNGVVSFGIGAGGVVHAANPGKHRVERYTREGKLLGHAGRFDGQNPEGFGGCCNPTNVTVDAAGRIYTTEKAGPRAKVLDAGGKLVAVIGDEVFHPTSKNMGIAVDSRGRVYVADTARLRILAFDPQKADAS